MFVSSALCETWSQSGTGGHPAHGCGFGNGWRNGILKRKITVFQISCVEISSEYPDSYVLGFSCLYLCISSWSNLFLTCSVHFSWSLHLPLVPSPLSLMTPLPLVELAQQLRGLSWGEGEWALSCLVVGALKKRPYHPTFLPLSHCQVTYGH